MKMCDAGVHANVLNDGMCASYMRIPTFAAGLGKALFKKDVPAFKDLLAQTHDNYQLYLAELTCAKQLNPLHRFIDVLHWAERSKLKREDA